MSRYRKVEVRIWSDRKFRSLSPMPASGQGLWFYLLVGPQTGIIPGLYRAGRSAMAEELGWTLEAFDKAFREVSQEGMVKADFDARLVWLPNALKHNAPANPNIVKSWRTELDLLPECDLKNDALEAMEDFLATMGEPFLQALTAPTTHLGKPSRKPSAKPYGKGSRKSTSKASPNQEQEQEQEQEDLSQSRAAREITSQPTSEERSDLEAKVMEVWEAYPTASTGAKRQPGRIDQEAIVEAIVRDGFDAVIVGTRNYQDAVAKWPPAEKKFIRPASRFYGGSDPDYLKNPVIWDKTPVDTPSRNPHEMPTVKFSVYDDPPGMATSAGVGK